MFCYDEQLIIKIHKEVTDLPYESNIMTSERKYKLDFDKTRLHLESWHQLWLARMADRQTYKPP